MCVETNDEPSLSALNFGVCSGDKRILELQQDLSEAVF